MSNTLLNEGVRCGFAKKTDMSFVRARDFNALYAPPARGGDGGDYYELETPGWHRLKKCMVYVTKHTKCTVAVAERYRTDEYTSVGTVLRVRVHAGDLSKMALFMSEMEKFDVDDESLGVVLVDERGANVCDDYTPGDTAVIVDIQPRGGEYTIGMVDFNDDDDESSVLL